MRGNFESQGCEYSTDRVTAYSFVMAQLCTIHVRNERLLVAERVLKPLSQFNVYIGMLRICNCASRTEPSQQSSLYYTNATMIHIAHKTPYHVMPGLHCRVDTLIFWPPSMPISVVTEHRIGGRINFHAILSENFPLLFSYQSHRPADECRQEVGNVECIYDGGKWTGCATATPIWCGRESEEHKDTEDWHLAG